MSITTDNTTFRGMNAPMIKQAIVSINVVCAVDPSPDENTVLYNAIGTITNEIVSL